MSLLREHYTYRPLRTQEAGQRPRVFLGSYMPFAGVRMYSFIDENDVAGSKNKIGPVGWRLPKQRSDDAALTPEREMVLA